jgi:hypothetical protein
MLIVMACLFETKKEEERLFKGWWEGEKKWVWCAYIGLVAFIC